MHPTQPKIILPPSTIGLNLLPAKLPPVEYVTHPATDNLLLHVQQRMSLLLIKQMKHSMIVIRHNEIQWNLSIKDTLGPGNLFTVERLSTLQRRKMY